MSDDKKELLEEMRRARHRVRIIRADLLRLEKLQRKHPQEELARWIEAKRRVLRDSEVFLECLESLCEATE